MGRGARQTQASAAASSEEIRRALTGRARPGQPSWVAGAISDREYLGFDLPDRFSLMRMRDLASGQPVRVGGRERLFRLDPDAREPAGTSQLARAVFDAVGGARERVALHVALDRSGSLMLDGAPEAQLRLAYAAAELNRTSNIRADVVSHSGGAGDCELGELVRAGQCDTGALAALRHIGGGAGPTADALWFGARQLKARDADRRVLLIATDDLAAHTPDTRERLHEAKDAEVEVVQVVVGGAVNYTDADLTQFADDTPWLRCDPQRMDAFGAGLAATLLLDRS